MTVHVVVIGDAVLDVDLDGRTDRLCPDAPVPVLDVGSTRRSPGGAGLTALLCAASGARVTLVAPLADDQPGLALAGLLRRTVTVLPLGHVGATRTKTRVRSSGQSLVRIDEGGPATPTDVPVDEVRRLLTGADVVLVSDYGAGVTHDPQLRRLLTEAAASRPVVWDPHPRGGSPVPGVALVTPNLAEAQGVAQAVLEVSGRLPGDVLADELCSVWGAGAVAVTAGADGAFLARSAGEPMFTPAIPAEGGDPCGAGDRFAASAAVAIATGALVPEAVGRAVADASAWVATGGAEGFRRREEPPSSTARDASPAADGPLWAGRDDLDRLGASLRARGALVATGGCFDIVHAGHVATLQAARRLGDALVVLLNSDESVARLKGPGRPVVTAADRARVLAAFDCVDAVVVFDDDDPRATLDQLRPDVWAKGGDYGGAPMPEAEVVRRHGGRVVLLPYLGGRSTTSILARSATGLAS